jgi:site-specific recombinase XerD
MPNLKVAARAAPTLLEGLVTDYLASCRARGLAPSTVNQAYAYSLQEVFLPWCALVGVETVDQLDQRALDRFPSGLLEDGGKRGKLLSKDTVHSYVRAVRQFLKWAAKEGEAVKGRPQLPRLTRRVLDVLSREEIERLEDAAPTERDKLIIRLLADTGIRVGELCGLRPEDIVRSQDRRTFLKVREKGSKERLVPLSPPLVRRLDRLQRGRTTETHSDRLFLALRKSLHGDYPALSTSGGAPADARSGGACGDEEAGASSPAPALVRDRGAAEGDEPRPARPGSRAQRAADDRARLLAPHGDRRLRRGDQVVGERVRQKGSRPILGTTARCHEMCAGTAPPAYPSSIGIRHSIYSELHV